MLLYVLWWLCRGPGSCTWPLGGIPCMLLDVKVCVGTGALNSIRTSNICNNILFNFSFFKCKIDIGTWSIILAKLGCPYHLVLINTDTLVFMYPWHLSCHVYRKTLILSLDSSTVYSTYSISMVIFLCHRTSLVASPSPVSVCFVYYKWKSVNSQCKVLGILLRVLMCDFVWHTLQ